MANLTLVIGNKNYSSWSLRAWLMLKQTGVAFEEVRIALDQPDTATRIRQYSPSGRVPVLLDGDLVLWESIAIGEYLAEQYPEAGLLPKEKTARAIARAVSAEMHSGFLALRQQLPMDCRTRHQNWQIAPAVQQDIDRITQLWQQCRAQFRHQDGDDSGWLFGDLTLADAMFAPVASRFVTYGVQLDPASQAYVDTIWALPAMQDWLTAAAAELEVIEAHKL
ncbi:MAG: glutathione S-transferase family protein [Leptolyngbyaceae cyanobacterium SL_7_1]|nr:glutathione S-transferase family protein [Leptolyngbyaceae cyanobacterium SL_7_1]